MRTYLLVATTIAASTFPSRADDARRAAEQLYADAQRTQDEAKYVACGNAYLDVYNRNSTAPDNDEVLYNAATCFELGKSVGSAVQAYELVLRYYPKSRIALKALMQSATVLARIGRFDDAATRFEDYAKKYAGEKDARDAIENAIMLRAATGDTAKRIDDTRYFVKAWGLKAPQAAADAMFALASVYERPDEQVAALREYIRTYGAKGKREQLTAAPRLAALKAQPYDVLVARGIAARRLGDSHAAEELYHKAIQADPARAEAHYDLGLLYELHVQPPAPKRAIEEYRRAASDPSLDANERIKALDKP